MKHYNVKSYARTPEIQELPSLIDIQLKSFEDFLYRGRLLELFDEINPIQSFNGNLSLYFPGNIPAAKEFDLRCEFSEPKYDEDACLERDISYAAPLHVYVALVNHEQGDEVIRQKIFLGDFPLMTEKGTFIINGTERVVVSQLIRSPGVYFDAEEERATGRLLSNCKLIPDRGAWMEFETRKTDYITLKFNRKRTVPVTMLLRALAAVDDGLPAKISPIKTGEDDEIRRLFAHVDTNEAHPYIESSIKNEPEWDVKKKQTIAEVALIEFYKRMRPGDPATLDNAREYLHSQLFDKRRYDLERVGRYKLNQRLDLANKINPSHRTITKADIVALVEQMIIINNGQRGRDDIDHLGNRRVKTVGELVGNKLRIGLRRMERLVKERMSIREAEQLAPVSLVNIRPVVAAVKEFFGSSQLSQFMEQTNPLSELTHKRTLSALGPGGLRRERAGFDVRDVHNSHYGRICPIETPEGPNIGLIGRLASYARVNELGFVETPYRKVVNKMPLFQTQQARTFEEAAVSRRRSRLQNATRTLLGREVNEDVEVSGEIIAKKGDIVDEDILNALVKHDIKQLRMVSYVSRKELIGRIAHSHVQDDGGNVIVEKNTEIDGEILRTLMKSGIRKIKVVSYADKEADNPDLIGRVVRDDIEDANEEVIVEEGTVIDAEIIKTLKKHGIEEIPVVPFATSDIEYLSADKEDGYRIAQANSLLDQRNQFVSDRISARHKQGFHTVRPERIDYMDVAPRQIVGISAALIPFLSHDDANRALMGSNMQRQAVPLIAPDVSVVSTGMEKQAASDSGQVLLADIEAEVVSVQGHRVTVKTAKGKEHHYALRKYDRSNQSTCIDQRPLVRKGDVIKPDDVIADSSSTYNGELALGHDVLTCFLSWDGGNYEDALLISEDMLRNDKFTSIHIEKHEIEARDTKLGPEEITYDIPNVGEETLKDLDERGIVRIGAEVGPNDILVGKITPKGEKELSPEEKLLRAIFGEQAREVKDSSLRLPHGDRGKVVDVKVFTRDEHPDLPAGVEKMVRVSVAQRRKLTVGDKMAGRHGNKGVISKIVPIADMPYIEGGVPVEIILNPLGVPGRMNIGQILELHLGWAADRLGFRAVTPVFDGAKEHEIQAELGRAWMMDWAWKMTAERAWENHERLAEMGQIAPEEFDDDMHVICAYLVDRVGESGRYDNEAIILERSEVYVRRVAVAEALRDFGYDPDEMMVYDNADLPLETRDRRDMKALEVSLRLWIQQNSPQGIELEESLEIRSLFEIADQVMFETGRPVPHYGKQTLYDGRTGEAFDRHVAVGYVHMLKLAHLVEDKAHARSTGPYSLVTQQPLGGKAQFGGQRFGEMEVWALEAYGAAYILQEMLTVKSDDVLGRVKTYESIVKGEPIEEPGIPTSFRVLVKELQSLGLAVEAITGNGDVIRFGKNEEHTRRPQPETGLLRFSAG